MSYDISKINFIPFLLHQATIQQRNMLRVLYFLIMTASMEKKHGKKQNVNKEEDYGTGSWNVFLSAETSHLN